MNGSRPTDTLVALGLGASMGNRRQRLERTVRQLALHPDLDLVRVSRWYITPPMRGGTAKGWFLNGVALFRTRLAPHDLLALCRQLESDAGRRRARHWGDRPLDLDLLQVDGLVLDTPDPTLPHPGVAARPFVYWPLLEVWPEAVDPRTHLRWADMPVPPPTLRVVAGVFARRPPLAYLTSHRTARPPHEALPRHRQPR